MTTPYRVGIIGAGAVADLHAEAIAHIEDATLVAACRRSEAPGRAFAERHGCTWYPAYETMLDEAAPDVVIITTPSGAHLPPTEAAAQRGIHVLCEKPLEITTDRVDRMIAVADAHGIRLGGIFQQRFSDVMRVMREAVSAGRLGDLVATTASVPWWRDDAYYEGTWKGTQALDGGGALINQSIHALDALQWMVAGTMDLGPREHPVAEVYAFTDVRGHDPAHIEGEDTAVVVLRWRNGALGHVLGSTALYPGSQQRLRVAGRDGTIELLEEELVQWQFREPRPEDDTVRQRFGAQRGASGASDPMAIDYEGHARNIKAFLDGIEGTHRFSLDGRAARKAVALVEAIYRSAETGRPVHLD